ncbi:MAG: Spi family protease inhibitor, partial [Paramuribaculum sp.]|nr:Spi family protease inhibitor [Paramuribaculum sp.]
MCKIFKHFIAIFLFTAILPATSAQARSLSPDEALDRALTASTQNELSVLSVKTGKSLYKLTEATPEYYVFNREGGGYIIVSADDRLYEILADVDNGSFSPDSIPGLKWITDGYTSEIKAFLAESDNSRKTANHSPLIHETSNLPSLYSKWDDIPPIMTTCWGQSSP